MRSKKQSVWHSCPDTEHADKARHEARGSKVNAHRTGRARSRVAGRLIPRIALILCLILTQQSFGAFASGDSAAKHGRAQSSTVSADSGSGDNPAQPLDDELNSSDPAVPAADVGSAADDAGPATDADTPADTPDKPGTDPSEGFAPDTEEPVLTGPETAVEDAAPDTDAASDTEPATDPATGPGTGEPVAPFSANPLSGTGDKTAPLGNIAPLGEASDPTMLYVSASGNDDTGNGTLLLPYATLNKAFEEAAATATVYVEGNLTLTSEVSAAGSVAKGISARNITLKKAPGISGSVTITRFKDHSDSEQSYIGYMFTVSAGSTLTIEGITIDGNKVAGSNAAVAVYGSFTMKDSTIEDNTVSGMGGGVYVMGGAARFDMQGGVITGNTAALGGSGVYLHSGAMNISGDVRIGDSDDDNGVYLTSNVRINIAGTLGSSARVNVEKHQNARVGTQIATKVGGGLTAADVGKFFWQTIAYKIVAGSGESADNCVLAVNETDFYIAGSGSDDKGKGSSDKPFATLTRAFEELPRGAGV
ncbi:MAG: hypothetical protein LBL23_04695, partial [Coriobacteriales bacterium]|nr:hypothetical protein [Coriobacteriales bacterium]